MTLDECRTGQPVRWISSHHRHPIAFVSRLGTEKVYIIAYGHQPQDTRYTWVYPRNLVAYDPEEPTP